MTDHILAEFNSSSLFCSHCGAHEAMLTGVPVMKFVAAGERFSQAHAACPKPDVMPERPCPNRTLPVDAALLEPWPGLEQWLRHGRVGASSLTLASAITMLPLQPCPTPPSDAADFQRCLDLLTQVPSLQQRLLSPETAAHLGEQWHGVLHHWDTLAKWLERGHRAAASDRIRLLTQPRGS